MSKVGAKDDARNARANSRVRTDGSPRLVAPGGRGNPSDDYWCVVWTERGDGPSRTRTWSTGETVQPLALRAFIKFKAARERPKEAVTVDDLLDRYVARKEADHKAKGRDPSLLKNIKSVLKPIRAHFGALSPSEVNPGYVRSYIAKRRTTTRQRGHLSIPGKTVEIGGTVSDRKISIELAYLRAAFRRALKEEEIARVPAFELPQATAKARRRALRRSEFKRFMLAVFADDTPAHLRAFVMLGILTGQRSKAIKALRWEFVDYEEGVIWFTKTDPDAADNKRIQDTPLTPDMTAYLQEVQAAALTDYVIEWNGVAPVGSLKNAWRRLVRRAELTDVRIHDLRRSAATVALNAGGNMSAIALLLNNDEATTRRNYAHASPDLLMGVVKLIEAEVDAAKTPE